MSRLRRSKPVFQKCPEVTLDDIKAANRIAHEVLGRSLDELPPQTRKLLGHVQQLACAACRKNDHEQQHFTFSRKMVRDAIGWTEYQVRVHLQKLEDLEYIERTCGRQGSACAYRLLYPMDADNRPHAVGLTDITHLRRKFEGSNGHFGQLRDSGPTKLQALPVKASGRNGVHFVASASA